jgi:nucleotide-binding universal stress UspA family protein
VQRNVELHVATAFVAPQNRTLSGTGLDDNQHAVMLDEAGRRLAEAVSIAEETDGFRASQRLTMGFPVPVLLEASEHAQLVVLGDRGHGRISGLPVGSVATAMASRAACPVVLVRDDDAPSDGRTRPVVVGVDSSQILRWQEPRGVGFQVSRSERCLRQAIAESTS